MVEAEFLHKITVAEYERMGELGILDPERRYELLAGMILDVSPQNDPHAFAVTQLHELFVLAAAGRFSVRSQMPVILDDANMPEPDVVLHTRGLARRPRPADVFLAVEVSDATYRLDAGTKLRRYAASGIPEYWIVNLRAGRLEVNRRPDGWSYGEKSIARGAATIAPSAFPEIAISLRDLVAQA